MQRWSVLIGLVWLLMPSLLRAESGIPLFDGTSLDYWTTSDGRPIGPAWEIADGMLHLNPAKGRGGQLVTKQDYGNFELEFDWRITKGGNNGIKYRVRNYGKEVLGIEYQILDDSAHKGKVNRRGMTGSLYEIYEPTNLDSLRPVGEFNHSRVVVLGNHVEHWLNGELIVSAEVGSVDWLQRVAESKFRDKEAFGQNRLGKIMVTDHGTEVWLRGIILRPLAAPQLARVVSTRGSSGLACARRAPGRGVLRARLKRLGDGLRPARRRCCR